MFFVEEHVQSTDAASIRVDKNIFISPLGCNSALVLHCARVSWRAYKPLYCTHANIELSLTSNIHKIYSKVSPSLAYIFLIVKDLVPRALGPVVQSRHNFIQWINPYPTEIAQSKSRTR